MEIGLLKAMDKMMHDISISDLRKAYDKNRNCDLSYNDTLYLNIIEGHPNEYTASQIADMLKVTRPSVTQKINELVRKGYVIRTQSEKDKRVYYLSINMDNRYYTDGNVKEDIYVEQLVLEKYGQENIDLVCEMLGFITDKLIELEEGGNNG